MTSKIATFIDDFSTNDLATNWNGGYGSPVWSAGQVAIPCDSSYSSALTSTNSYDLTSSSIFAKVVPYVSSGAACNFIVGTSSNNITVTYTASSFESSTSTAGSYGYVGDIGYNATSMAWWRIREASGTIYVDTSPDGTTWTNQFSTTYSFTATSLPVTFNGGGASVTGNNIIKNVNTTGGSPPAVNPSFLMAAGLV